MEKVLSTFTTMRVVPLLTVIILLQPISYSVMNANLGFKSTHNHMILWSKLSSYEVITDIQELT